MSTTALITALVPLAYEVFKLINTVESKKHSQKLLSLENELDAELRLPLEKQNDAKVERLEDEIANILPLATAELVRMRENKA